MTKLIVLILLGTFSVRAEIPLVLHRVFLEGEEAFRNQSSLAAQWHDWCVALHPHWQHMFWDKTMADELVQSKFPWFLDTWESYDRIVERGDAMRQMVLHEHGGLYLDLDIQCVQPADVFLADNDVVVQGSDFRSEVVHQAAIASKQHEPLLIQMLELMVQRQREDPPRYPPGFDSVIYKTGPGIVRAILEDVLDVDDLLPETLAGVDGSLTYNRNNSRVKIYDHAHWYVLIWGPGPSNLGLEKHHHHLSLGDLPRTYAGFHHGRGSWAKNAPI